MISKSGFFRGSGFDSGITYFIKKKKKKNKINTQSSDHYWFQFRPSLHDVKCLIKNESSSVLGFPDGQIKD